MTTKDTEPVWANFASRLEKIGLDHLKELEQSVEELNTMVETRLKHPLPKPDFDPAKATLAEIADRRKELRSYFLEQPWNQLNKNRTFKKFFLTLENYQRSFEELCRSLPNGIMLNGQELLDFLGENAPKGWTARKLRWKKEGREFDIKTLVSQQFSVEAVERAAIEDELFYSVTLMLRLFSLNWEAVSSVNHQEYLSEARLAESVETREKLQVKLLKAKQTSELALSKWRTWSKQLAENLAAATLDIQRHEKLGVHHEKRTKHQEHWTIQLRTIEEELRTLRTLEECWDVSLLTVTDALAQQAGELVSMLAELDEVVSWLNARKENPENKKPFPMSRAQVVPGNNRVNSLEAAFVQSLKVLPVAVNSLGDLKVHPFSKKDWKELKPRDAMEVAFSSQGRAPLLELFEQIESEHRKIIQEVEHTRDVINFAMDDEQVFETNVAEEALANSLSLMQYYRGEDVDWRDAIEPKLSRIYVQIIEDAHIRLYQGRIGVFRYLARQGLASGFSTVAKLSKQNATALLAASKETLEDSTHSFLVNIGWTREEPDGKACVTVRDYLPVEFAGEARRKELPSIYRRLFRLHPVDDPRFLVGRAVEIEALWEARHLWESGRPVAVLLTGQRGSGKTSLINCAELSVFQNLDVVRTEFEQRITDPEALDAHLREILELEEDVDIREALRSKRRVLILEETERLFLRQVGHYRAIRHLQNLIAATSDRCFWLVALNEVSGHLLDRATGLRQRFTHEINSVVVGRKEIEQAVMVRHGLSGFRLQFAPLIDTSKKKKKGLIVQSKSNVDDLKDEFFRELARRSNGIFRTAIELWLGHIDTFESGTLYMKPVRNVSLQGMIAGLDADDIFSLVAILQHGSLTTVEHATIFDCSLEASDTAMDELLGREILESDPKYPGLRIRPEAMPLVKEALYRRNLL